MMKNRKYPLVLCILLSSLVAAQADWLFDFGLGAWSPHSEQAREYFDQGLYVNFNVGAEMSSAVEWRGGLGIYATGSNDPRNY